MTEAQQKAAALARLAEGVVGPTDTVVCIVVTENAQALTLGLAAKGIPDREDLIRFLSTLLKRMKKGQGITEGRMPTRGGQH